MTLLGALLRIASAQGDLWLDEIWSLNLVGGVHSPGAVFWGISHDNNHFLNSLWLYVLGPNQPPWAYRLPAVVLGTLSIPLAARLGGRSGQASGVAAALLAASAVPLVTYGSEARGYAGLITATLLAIDAFERALGCFLNASLRDGSETAWEEARVPRWVLGAAIGFGALCHLTMISTLAVLGVTAILRLRGAGFALGPTVDAVLRLFRPSLILLLPVMAAVLGGIAHKGGFEAGGISAFTRDDFLHGFGELLRLMMGLPETAPIWAVFAAAAGAAGIAFAFGPLGPGRRALAVSALVVLPGGMALARLPNLEFPRYFLASGLVFLLVEAAAFGRLWDSKVALARGSAVVLFGAVLLGNLSWDVSLLRTGRGSYAKVTAIMSTEGRPVFTSNNRFQTQTVVDFTAHRAQLAFEYAAPETYCDKRPDWYIDANQDGRSPISIEIGPDSCRATFVQFGIYPASVLSGMRWILYRRAA